MSFCRVEIWAVIVSNLLCGMGLCSTQYMIEKPICGDYTGLSLLIAQAPE